MGLESEAKNKQQLSFKRAPTLIEAGNLRH